MTADAELGALRQRLTAGSRDQRELSWVRGVSAILSLGCATLLLLADVPVPVFIAALLGVLMALLWLAQARRAARAARTPEAHFLAVYELGLVVAAADKLTVIRFADVRSIEEDHERVDVVITLQDGRVIRIEPRYPGLAIHELAHMLQSASAETSPRNMAPPHARTSIR